MKNNISKFKKSAHSCAVTFLLLAAFLGFIFFSTSATAAWQMLRGEYDFSELPVILGGSFEFLLTAISFLVMAVGLFNVSETGKPFSEKNVKTFKASGCLMTAGGIIGSVVSIIMTRFLPEAESVDMEGMGVGLIFCGMVIVMFVDFLRYGSEVQDELDSIA